MKSGRVLSAAAAPSGGHSRPVCLQGKLSGPLVSVVSGRAGHVPQRRFSSAQSSDAVYAAAPLLERFSLRRRVAIVTGAGQGIGRALAHGLVEAHIEHIVLADRQLAKAEEVAVELEKKSQSFNTNTTVAAVHVDVTDKKSVESMVQAAGPRLDIAVNNAGVVTSGLDNSSESIPESQWDETFDINTKGVFLCCQAEANLMIQNGYGKIINTASMSGHIVNEPQKQSAYNASKAAVHMLTKSLAAEWATKGIRVNSLSPGYVRTTLIEKPGLEAVLQHWLDRTPNHRLAEVTDLQGAVLYMASAASDHMTGGDIVVDGGFVCW